MCYTSRIPQPPSFNHPNNMWWRVQMTVLIMQFFSHPLVTSPALGPDIHLFTSSVTFKLRSFGLCSDVAGYITSNLYNDESHKLCYYEGDEIKETFNTYWRDKMHTKYWSGRLEGMTTLERPRRIWEDNIRMDIYIYILERRGLDSSGSGHEQVARVNMVIRLLIP
jgi:hypothetical protein